MAKKTITRADLTELYQGKRRYGVPTSGDQYYDRKDKKFVTLKGSSVQAA